MKKISNPLTIIGMFAGIAEVSGTVVLPFIDRSLQYLFIWYVMGFPVFLVAVFFLTMNYNPNVLYAPSDFDDENNYVKLAQKRVNEVDEEIENIKQNNTELADRLEKVQWQLSYVLPEADKQNEISKDIYTAIASNNGITLVELANRFKISKSFAHRHLTDLLNKDLILYFDTKTADGEKMRVYKAKK